MKYHQPGDQVDPLAPYVDAVPSLGIDGSIVTAKAIEGPQREITNVITSFLDPSQPPTDADFFQLKKAIILAPIANTRIVYVDPVNGQDTNFGVSSATAMRTINAALNRAAAGQNLVLLLMSDITLTAGISTGAGSALVTGWDAINLVPITRTITIATSAQTAVDEVLPGACSWIFRTNAFLGLRNINIRVNVAAAYVNGQGTITFGAGGTFYWAIGSLILDTGMLNPFLSAAPFLASTFTSVSLSSNYPGHLFAGVGAAVNPNTLYNYRSSITSG